MAQPDYSANCSAGLVAYWVDYRKDYSEGCSEDYLAECLEVCPGGHSEDYWAGYRVEGYSEWALGHYPARSHCYCQ